MFHIMTPVFIDTFMETYAKVMSTQQKKIEVQ